jgi:hypothetical protein
MGKTAVLWSRARTSAVLTSGRPRRHGHREQEGIGGVSREFYRRVKAHYETPAA